ncbi:MAG: DUF4276 family protein [Chitinophagales bacterium]|nr:DUF4276 family protein [Chitinophagales bacterium]
MPNPAFIVDGHTEQCFISQICPGRPIQRTNLNGKNVTISAIAKKISSMIRMFGNRHYPIIVLIDKEDRENSIKDICTELHDNLIAEGITDQDVRIGVADRMIENWIVADYQLIGNVQEKPDKTDGLRGSSVIKKCVGSYNKVIDGVNFLASINKTIVYQNSPSFKSFVDKLDGIECEYVNFQK